MSKMNQAKELLKLQSQARKAKKELAREIIEVEAGDGAVVVKMNGEMKVKAIEIDSDEVDLDNIEELEEWLEAAVEQAIEESQKRAQEKMKPLLGQLNIPGM